MRFKDVKMLKARLKNGWKEEKKKHKFLYLK